MLSSFASQIRLFLQGLRSKACQVMSVTTASFFVYYSSCFSQRHHVNCLDSMLHQLLIELLYSGNQAVNSLGKVAFIGCCVASRRTIGASSGLELLASD